MSKFDNTVLDLIEVYDEQPLITPAWVVSQNFLPDTVVEIVKLEHERRARRFNSPEAAKERCWLGNVVVIPDPDNPKMLKLYFTNWDSS